jgi:hypothetical protein
VIPFSVVKTSESLILITDAFPAVGTIERSNCPNNIDGSNKPMYKMCLVIAIYFILNVLSKFSFENNKN